jgi:hypothetical protein
VTCDSGAACDDLITWLKHMSGARSNKRQRREKGESSKEEEVQRWAHDKFKPASSASAVPAVPAAAAASDAAAAASDAAPVPAASDAAAAAAAPAAPPAADGDASADADSAAPPSAPLPDIFKLPCGSMPKPSRARLHTLIKTKFPFLVSSFINGENGGGGSIGIAAAAAAAAIGPKRARGGTGSFSDKFFTYFYLEKENMDTMQVYNWIIGVQGFDVQGFRVHACSCYCFCCFIDAPSSQAINLLCSKLNGECP